MSRKSKMNLDLFVRLWAIRRFIPNMSKPELATFAGCSYSSATRIMNAFSESHKTPEDWLEAYREVRSAGYPTVESADTESPARSYDETDLERSWNDFSRRIQALQDTFDEYKQLFEDVAETTSDIGTVIRDEIKRAFE